MGIKVVAEDWARVMVELQKLGGQPESYDVAAEVLEEAIRAVEEAQQDSSD